MKTDLFFGNPPHIADAYNQTDSVFLVHGETLATLQGMPAETATLIISSPPYNIGKEYEARKELSTYLNWLNPVLQELVRVLSPNGSICWQVGNFVEDSEVFPLDIYFYPIFKNLGLKLRNRIIWHFEHGLHCSVRLSGRYETLLWFTKAEDYTFNLDSIRVPSKYPGKTHFKPGPKYGKPSGNPLGKNPSDVWTIMVKEWEEGLWNIPNVKANHPEKTIHPCQFPIELIERLVLSMTNEKDVVVDPYAGVGSALCAAIINNRKGYGSDITKTYLDIAKERIQSAANGTLKRRPMGTPIFQPENGMKLAELPQKFLEARKKLFGARL